MPSRQAHQLSPGSAETSSRKVQGGFHACALFTRLAAPLHTSQCEHLHAEGEGRVRGTWYRYVELCAIFINAVPFATSGLCSKSSVASQEDTNSSRGLGPVVTAQLVGSSITDRRIGHTQEVHTPTVPIPKVR